MGFRCVLFIFIKYPVLGCIVFPQNLCFSKPQNVKSFGSKVVADAITAGGILE